MNGARRTLLKAGAALPWVSVAGGVLAVEGRTTVEVAYFLRIAEDGRVVVGLAKHEMGQGVAGSIAAILADELGADWARVDVDFMDHDPRYRFNTGGSTTIQGLYDPLRRIAATVRERLIAVAARDWGVEPAACEARGNAVVHAASGRRAGFGELAPRVAPLTDRPLRDVVAAPSPPLRAARTLVGTPLPNKTHAAIVDGTLRYAGDVRLPGMLYAVVARCPVYRGRLGSYDARRAVEVPGVVKVVRVAPYLPAMTAANDDTSWCMHEGIAVLATSTWAAMKGREALVVAWDGGPNGGVDTPGFDALMASRSAAPGRAVHEAGTRDALAASHRQVEATYAYPFEAHACMETMNAVARVGADDAELWIGTQNTGNILAQATRVLGIAAGRLVVHHFPSGGGFGRRYYPDVAIEALAIARQAGGAPVKVLWTREDDIRHGIFHFASQDRYRGGLDAAGRITALHLKETSPGFLDGSAIWNPYTIPNTFHDAVGLARESPVKTGAWRSVSNNAWGFGLECFMDELAHAAGQDPLEFRLAHLTAPQSIRAWGSVRATDPARLAHVLRVAARAAGWGTPLADGRARGIACYDYLPCKAFCAHVAEVSVVEGRLVIHRITAALDCGLVVNPDAVRAQVEGNLAWGLSALRMGGITLEKGRVQQSNFHDFQVLRMPDCPPIDIHLVASQAPPGGVGETSLPSLIPAVLNAIFAATGRRIRRLPVDLAERA